MNLDAARAHLYRAMRVWDAAGGAELEELEVRRDHLEQHVGADLDHGFQRRMALRLLSELGIE